jgi:hypothetical protein
MQWRRGFDPGLLIGIFLDNGTLSIAYVKILGLLRFGTACEALSSKVSTAWRA